MLRRAMQQAELGRSSALLTGKQQQKGLLSGTWALVLGMTLATSLLVLLSISSASTGTFKHPGFSRRVFPTRSAEVADASLGGTTDAPMRVLPPFEPTCFAPVSGMHLFGCPVMDCLRDANCTIHNPICCAYLHMQMLTWFDRFMTSKCLDNEWVLVYGSTLGALRQGTIMAHTEDLDIALTPQAIQFLEQNHTRAELWRHGYAFWHHHERSVWKLCPHLHHPSPHFQAAMVRNESMAAWEARTQKLVAVYTDFWLMWPVPEQTPACTAVTELDLGGVLQTPWDGQPPGSVHSACPYLQQAPSATAPGPVRQTFCVSELAIPLILGQGVRAATIGAQHFPVAENAYEHFVLTYGRNWREPHTGYHGESVVSPAEDAVRTGLLQKLSVTVWGDMTYHERRSRCQGRPQVEPFSLED